MQQPDQIQPPAPPEPPTPAELPAAAAPTAVTVDGATIPLQGLPRTAQEVRGLRERREILRDQLERATNRRDNLVNELNSGREGDEQLAPAARAGIEQRLKVVDERIIQLERDQAMTERLLSNAAPAVLAQAAALEERNSGPDEDEIVVTAFSMFGAGVLLTLLVGRIRLGLARRRGGGVATATANALPANDPRIDRLTQTIDAIAEEVERIGEGQRFVTQLMATRRQEAPMLSGDPDRR